MTAGMTRTYVHIPPDADISRSATGELSTAVAVGGAWIVFQGDELKRTETLRRIAAALDVDLQPRPYLVHEQAAQATAAERDALRAELEAVKAKRDRWRQGFSDLKAEVRAVGRQVDEVARERDGLRAGLEASDRALQTARDGWDKTVNELETVKAERDSMAEERDAALAEIRRCDEACDPDSEPCHAVLDEAEKARNGEAALAGALETTRRKLRDSREELAAAKTELGEVKNRLAGLRAGLIEMFDREAAVRNAVGRGSPRFEEPSISVTMGPPQDGGDDG